MSLIVKGMEMPELEYHRCKLIRHNDGFYLHVCVSIEITDDFEPVEEWKEYPLLSVPPRGSAAIEKVISERISQIERWGEDTYNHPFEWMSILGEEFGELCEAVNETCFMNGTHPERGGDENIVREATQIAAVAVAIIEAFLPSDTAPTIIPADTGS